MLHTCLQSSLSPALTAHWSHGPSHGNRGPIPALRLLGPISIGTKEVYVHDLCALFAPNKVALNFNIALDIPLEAADLDVESLAKVESDSADKLCRICGRSGAVSSCWFAHCQHAYHLPCAEKAGLVEWHYFHSHTDLTDFAVVHCPTHRDPLCEIWWAGDEVHPETAWWPCAVIGGPKEGLLPVIYTHYPFETEDLNVNATKLRFPHKVDPPLPPCLLPCHSRLRGKLTLKKYPPGADRLQTMGSIRSPLQDQPGCSLRCQASRKTPRHPPENSCSKSGADAEAIFQPRTRQRVFSRVAEEVSGSSRCCNCYYLAHCCCNNCCHCKYSSVAGGQTQCSGFIF